MPLQRVDTLISWGLRVAYPTDEAKTDHTQPCELILTSPEVLSGGEDDGESLHVIVVPIPAGHVRVTLASLLSGIPLEDAPMAVADTVAGEVAAAATEGRCKRCGGRDISECTELEPEPSQGELEAAAEHGCTEAQHLLETS